MKAFVHTVMGVPEDCGEDLLELIIIANDTIEPLLSASRLRAIDGAMARISACLVNSRRPAGSFMAFLAPPDEELTDFHPKTGIAVTVAEAFVTVLQTLTLMIHDLLLQPQAVWLQMADPGVTGDLIEKALSVSNPTLFIGRAVKSDVQIGGCPFTAGETALMDIRQINTSLRASHGPQAHMSFGFGPHKCIGEHLGRVFLSEALPRLARAFPDLTLQRDLVRYKRTPVLQCAIELPCLLGAENVQINPRMTEIRSRTDARELLNDDGAWSPPDMVRHLEGLAQHSGRDLSDAICFARNAPFFLSGERHATARRAVFAQIGGNRLETWQPVWEAAVASSLDHLSRVPEPDLIRDFTDILFKRTVKPVLGIPQDNCAQFDEMAPHIQLVLAPLLPLRDLLEVQKAMAALMTRLQSHAADGGDGLLAALLGEEMDGFDRRDKMALTLVLYGASFNIRHTLGNILHHLLSMPPDQRRALLLSEDTAGLFDRLIGLCAAPKYIYRIARNDENALGVPAGTTLRFRLAVLNRAAPAGHLAFGHGLHRCFGAAMSRQIIRLAVPAFFNRFPQLELDPRRHVFAALSQTIALESLPCMPVVPERTPDA
ncbi:hypothetical protein [Rhizobium sp. CSW-27]|uniref:hypothetical protein n=1 Tax=Rhizobium sp. CSW-27 TaxID=2839985 RepID=UPI001C02FF66|nr:hypothetical protein [Rhizobium sp. CSW-27]MBT9373342.1 hypothetical protein [Rhizobium sp. CSW-27]